MNTTNLNYFKTVAELGNITLAADKLYISQPALSKTIHALEKEIGYRLFDRVGKNIILNKQGEIFLQYTIKALNALEDAKKELDDYNQIQIATVHIQLCAAAQYFVSLLAEFQRNNPDIHFRLIEPGNSEIQPELIIYASEDECIAENCETLFDEDLVLAVPISHPLASFSSVCIQDFFNEKFLVLSEGHAMRRTFNRYFNEHLRLPTIAYETDNFSLLKSMVSNGLGISIIPSFSWKDIEEQGLCRQIPIRDISFRRYVHIKWDNERYFSKASRVTLDFLFQYHK